MYLCPSAGAPVRWGTPAGPDMGSAPRVGWCRQGCGVDLGTVPMAVARAPWNVSKQGRLGTPMLTHAPPTHLSSHPSIH